MLAAQTAAHLALLWAGAPAHPGVPGSLALHLALAVMAAVLVQRIDVHTRRRALAALAAPPLPAPPRPGSHRLPQLPAAWQHGTAAAGRRRSPPDPSPPSGQEPPLRHRMPCATRRTARSNRPATPRPGGRR